MHCGRFHSFHFATLFAPTFEPILSTDDPLSCTVGAKSSGVTVGTKYTTWFIVYQCTSASPLVAGAEFCCRSSQSGLHCRRIRLVHHTRSTKGEEATEMIRTVRPNTHHSTDPYTYMSPPLSVLTLPRTVSMYVEERALMKMITVSAPSKPIPFWIFDPQCPP